MRSLLNLVESGFQPPQPPKATIPRGGDDPEPETVYDGDKDVIEEPRRPSREYPEIIGGSQEYRWFIKQEIEKFRAQFKRFTGLEPVMDNRIFLGQAAAEGHFHKSLEDRANQWRAEEPSHNLGGSVTPTDDEPATQYHGSPSGPIGGGDGSFRLTESSLPVGKDMTAHGLTMAVGPNGNLDFYLPEKFHIQDASYQRVLTTIDRTIIPRLLLVGYGYCFERQLIPLGHEYSTPRIVFQRELRERFRKAMTDNTLLPSDYSRANASAFWCEHFAMYFLGHLVRNVEIASWFVSTLKKGLPDFKKAWPK